HEEGAAALRAAGGRVRAFTESEEDETDLFGADLIVDGLLGIGGRGGLRESYATLAAAAAGAPAPVIAVDLPSGIDADTGEVSGMPYAPMSPSPSARTSPVCSWTPPPKGQGTSSWSTSVCPRGCPGPRCCVPGPWTSPASFRPPPRRITSTAGGYSRCVPVPTGIRVRPCSPSEGLCAPVWAWSVTGEARPFGNRSSPAGRRRSSRTWIPPAPLLWNPVGWTPSSSARGGGPGPATGMTCKYSSTVTYPSWWTPTA